jgi:hypothetical protein
MVLPPSKHDENALDFNDGRTSRLERLIVWIIVAASMSEIVQGLLALWGVL